MQNAVNHIIHRLVLEISTNSKERGYAIKDDAAGFVSGRLAPELDKFFEELEARLNGRVLHIDKLTLDLNVRSSEWQGADLERKVSEVVLKELEKQLAEAELDVSSGNAERKLYSGSFRNLQTVFYFLKTGTRPWWISGNSQMSALFTEENLFALVREDPALLLNEICSSGRKSFTRRIILQLPENVLRKWISELFLYSLRSGAFPPGKKLVEKLAGKAASLQVPTQYYEKCWTILLQLLRELHAFGTFSESSLKALKEVVKEIPSLSDGSEKAFVKLIGQMKGADKQELPENEPEDDIAEKEFVLMENAGLILLHPFLKPFLTETGLLENNGLKNPELMAHVLHFIATGQECAAEYELSFEKYICGISADEPVCREVAIPGYIKEEAINMLKAATAHWKGLRSESYELLQTEFLQREAKLIIDEFRSVRLVFDRKTHDILMESLPWNLGIVKLNWKEELIYVEW